MISFLKALRIRILSSPEKRVILENFASLSFLKAANIILPLITLPYLVRVIGPNRYGLVAFAEAFMHYFVFLTDYGFGLSATREISIYRDNSNKVSEIFSSVMTIKTLFLVLSFLIMILVILFSNKFSADASIYLFSFGMVIGNVLFPTWFYQGMEKMIYITFLNLLWKLIFTLSIFIFVREQADYLWVPLLNSAGYLSAGFVSLWIVFKKFHVVFSLPSPSQIKYHLKHGWHIFISMVSIHMYTTTNTFLLGLFTSNTAVGYYSAGEKIIRSATQLFGPFFQAIYPYISKTVSASREKAVQELKTIFRYVLIICIPLSGLVFLMADPIIILFFGEDFRTSAVILRILSPLFIIIPSAYIFANLCLLPFNLDKYFSKIYISGGLINIGLLFLFLYLFRMEGAGAAWSNMITELILTLMMFLALRKNKIFIF